MDFDTEENLKRSKRFVRFNHDTQFFLAMIFFVPITTVLPVLTHRGLEEPKFPNLPDKLETEVAKSIFNNIGNIRLGRSVPDLNTSRFHHKGGDDTGFVEHPIAQRHVDRILEFFHLLKIPEVSCQKRIICELSSNPGDFNPISYIFLNRIRDPEIPPWIIYPETGGYGPSLNSSNSKPQSLYSLYNLAADLGMTSGPEKCEQEFGVNCPRGIEHVLNLPMLQMCNLLAKQFNLQFEDGEDF